MSIKELDKLEVLLKLVQKTINQEQASYILRLSVRQIQRLVRQYKNPINFKPTLAHEKLVKDCQISEKTQTE